MQVKLFLKTLYKTLISCIGYWVEFYESPRINLIELTSLPKSEPKRSERKKFGSQRKDSK